MRIRHALILMSFVGTPALALDMNAATKTVDQAKAAASDPMALVTKALAKATGKNVVAEKGASLPAGLDVASLVSGKSDGPSMIAALKSAGLSVVEDAKSITLGN